MSKVSNMIVGFHYTINNDFWRYLEITFRRCLVIILKISVRFTLKELRWEFSSSFGIISGSEEGGILFLQIAVMFGMKKKSRVKENIEYQNIFTNKKKKDHSII